MKLLIFAFFTVQRESLYCIRSSYMNATSSLQQSSLFTIGLQWNTIQYLLNSNGLLPSACSINAFIISYSFLKRLNVIQLLSYLIVLLRIFFLKNFILYLP